jgi:hypothetical protein
MGVNDTLYSARFARFEYIEQGRANTLACRVYRDGALVVPSSGTVSVYDASNTAIVSAVAATVAVDGVVTYSLLAAAVSASSRGDGWRIEWALTIAGVVYTFRTDASLVLRALYPCWTEADLYMLESSLDPSGTACIHSLTDFSDKIDSAFAQIERWLVAKGDRPNLIISPTSLYDWGVRLTLCDIFEDFCTRLNPVYREKADKYRQLAKDARDAVNYVYDKTDSGSRSDTGRKSAAGTMWLNGRGGYTGYTP